ncbi:MAG TPA: NUDIX domain-containing protein [Candidatus Nitrosocosmicus sp.]|nr:NUDIX domain-containing protein [Candidatus Nitrosocosmicus sp.]
MNINYNASLILLIHNDKVLLILRDKDPVINSPNCWCFPGGIKEENETFAEACKREVKEELGLTLQKVDFIKTILYEDRCKYYYVAKISDFEKLKIKLNEGQRYDFFTIDEIEELPLARSTKLFITECRDLLKNLLDPETSSG